MIKFLPKGDIFKSECYALVNPVNCVGVMGRGLALRYRVLYPQNYAAYQDECELGRMLIGNVFAFHESGKVIINIPTKWHWKDHTKAYWIIKGLRALTEYLINYHIKSVAIPALGCGLGGLSWSDIGGLFVRTGNFLESHGCDLVEIYADRIKSWGGKVEG